MVDQTQKKYLLFAWTWIGLFLLFKLIYIQLFLLVPDEANYWQWSRHLAWGYHDQAPMIAWTIHWATALFGNTEFAVRLPSVIAMTIATIYLFLLTRRWFGVQIGWQTVLISQSIFIYNVGALLSTADGLQSAAWAAATYHASCALESGRWRPWLVCGVWFGIGLLSKYTVILFLPCILAYVIFSSRHRRFLKSIKPYIAFGFGCAMFLPVIIWNADHNWNSLRHVAYIGGANNPMDFHLNYLIEFIGSQVGLFTPLVFILIVAAWVKIIRKKYSPDLWILSFLFWVSFPIVAGFTIMNFHSRVYANWPCFAYVPTIVLISVFWAYQREDITPSF